MGNSFTVNFSAFPPDILAKFSVFELNLVIIFNLALMLVIGQVNHIVIWVSLFL